MKRSIVAAALVAVSACSAAPPPEKSPVEIRSEAGISSASWGKTPAGTRLAACPLFRGKRALTIVLAVPNRFDQQNAEGYGCTFGHDWQDVAVSGKANRTLYERVEKDLKPYEDGGGDDSVSDIKYSADVPAFGGRRGEHLTYFCFCDGQEIENEDYRTAGVVIGESRSHLTKPFPKPVLASVLPTVGVEPGLFGIVAIGKSAVRYEVTDKIDSMMSVEHGLDLYFGGLNYHRIELRVGMGSLADERARLSRDKTVTGLALTDAAHAVDGRPGQRLSYDQTFEEYDHSNRVEHVVAYQSGRTRVAVINDKTGDHRQRFRDSIRELD